MIGVIEYAAGNAPSVGHALAHLGIAHRLAVTPPDLDGCDRIILPGVGAAPATMQSLDETGLRDAILARIADGSPFLGICIGLQVLASHSDEGDVECLGLIPGTVTRFPDSVRVPQIGWNTVTPTRPHPVLVGVPADSYCYFVNSYYAQADNESDVLARTEYGVPFASMLARDNIVAAQFHAEKSGPVGLRMLMNFAAWDGRS